jgi:hypothetical protein
MGDREFPPIIVVMVANDNDTPPPPPYSFVPDIMKPTFLTFGSIAIIDTCLTSIVGSNPTTTTSSWVSSPGV